VWGVGACVGGVLQVCLAGGRGNAVECIHVCFLQGLHALIAAGGCELDTKQNLTGRYVMSCLPSPEWFG
jgi:hypothetical protein